MSIFKSSQTSVARFGRMRTLALAGLAVLVSGSLGSAATTGFELKDEPGKYLEVLQNGRLLARYMYAYDMSTPASRAETFKPYLHVFDVEGGGPITKGGGGTFPHHHGIFLGWNKLTVAGKTYDRWHMVKGEQIHEKFLAQTADAKHATFTSLIRYTGEMNQPPSILSEERTFTFQPAPAPAYALIDQVSKLKAVGGETVLDGDPEHAGLQFRPAAEVDTKQTVYVLPAEKANAHKDRDYPWVGESYTLKEKRLSVVEFNHPENPKNTLFSAYRDYGRFGAFFKTTIAADAELTLRMRFLIAEGEMPALELIQKVANEFTGQSQPVPKVTVQPAERDEKAGEKKKPATPGEAVK